MKPALILCLTVLCLAMGFAGGYLFRQRPSLEDDPRANFINKLSENMLRQVIDARGAEKRCALHDAELCLDVVPVVYGLRADPPGEEDARLTTFPRAKSSIPGGCMVSVIEHEGRRVELQTAAVVLYCSQCRAAEKEWIALHPRPTGEE